MRHTIKWILPIVALVSGTGISAGVFADSPHSGHGSMSPGMYMHGKSWMGDLTDEQQSKIDQLRLKYKQQKYLLKAKIQQAKTELALLITTDSPNQGAIDKKIDQIVDLKREKMKLKAGHKIEVRKLLTDAQRVHFDMHVLKRATGGKCHGRGRGH
jgi:Spy/CpxP family protein refolding chaperone